MDKYEEFHRSTSVQKVIIKPNNFTYRLLFQVFEKYLTRSSSVLDIGCGAGVISLYAGSKGKKVFGFDISRKAITEAKKSSKRLKLNNVKFDVLNFPKDIPEGCYDLILCFEVLEHLEDDSEALKRIYKLLEKNGKVIISVPSRNAPLYRIGYASNFDKRVGHLRRYTLNSLKTLLTENNFKIIETRRNEGILRNFLFLNRSAGQLVRVMKSYVGDLFTVLDNITVYLFGESQIIIVAQKK